MNTLKTILLLLLALAIVLVVGVGGFWYWGICRHYCPKGTSLRVYKKTGPEAGKDKYAEASEQGVREGLLGPGRHFYDPYNYELERVDDVLIEQGQIGVVTSKVGDTLPQGRFLAQPGEKGVQEDVLTPGRWRINDYGASVEVLKATHIPSGYVGVQTLRAGENKGVMDEVLTPGLYFINPKKIRVDRVEIGYREKDISVVRRNGRIADDSGVAFPLADGKQMHLDFTVIWGIMPKNAPRIIREFGSIAEVEKKVIEPQVTSICKNNGSNLTTQQFIEGATREQFQETVTRDLKALGEEKGIEFRIALVRAFYPAEDITTTIQARKIAEEEKKTIAVELETDRVAARLEEATRKVEITVNDFNAETEALVQEEREKGLKKAAETRADTDRKVAGLDRETAEIQAEIVKILGKADADVIEAKKTAEANRFQQFVQAFGGGGVYNLAQFAELLPESLRIEYRYAGPGTFWTDALGAIKGFNIRDAASLKLLEKMQKEGAK